MLPQIWSKIKKKALIVGISDYEFLTPLEFCRNDGEEMLKVLKSQGFEVQSLIGRVEHNKIKKKTALFFDDEDITPSDILLFYYSGHGVPDYDYEDHYLAPSRLDPDKPYLEGYSFDEFGKSVGRTSSKRIVIILDCCYSGAATLGGKGVKLQSKGAGSQNKAAGIGAKAIKKKANTGIGEGTYLLAACQGSQEAINTKKADHSLFTYYLLAGLRGDKRAIDQEGNVTPDRLSEYVFEEIMSLPFKERPKQKPIKKVDNAAGKLVLAHFPDYSHFKPYPPKAEIEAEYFNIPYKKINQILMSRNIKQRISALNTLVISTQMQRGNRTPDEIIINDVDVVIYDAKHSDELGNIPFPPSSIEDIAITETCYNLIMIYNFFKNVYGRNSIDNKGMKLSAVINYGTDNNAFWDGETFIFGSTDGKLFYRFTKFIDVIASEYVKGIVGYETQLQYLGQQGSLINHYGDIFGSLIKQYELNQTVEKADWLIGQGLFMPNINAKALRSLKEPGTTYDDALLGEDPQVWHMKKYKDVKYDNGGVHIFSGIPNHAFYVAAIEMGGYAWDRAGNIWYSSLKNIGLERISTFQEFANITFKVAGDLYGQGKEEQMAVRKGWDKVGIKVL